MVPDIDLVKLLGSLGEGANQTLIGGTYHGKSNKGKVYQSGKKKGMPLPPTWWDEHFPDGVDVRISNGLGTVIIVLGSFGMLWAFWDLIINWLDKQGYRQMDNTMWQQFLSIGVLGGAGGIAKNSSDWFNDRRNELLDTIGKIGAKAQGKG